MAAKFGMCLKHPSEIHGFFEVEKEIPLCSLCVHELAQEYQENEQMGQKQNKFRPIPILAAYKSTKSILDKDDPQIEKKKDIIIDYLSLIEKKE